MVFTHTKKRGTERENVIHYAADNMVANGPVSCQRLLSKAELWLHWSGLKTKLQNATALQSDPQLMLDGKPISLISDHTRKFLGGPISVPQSSAKQTQALVDKVC